MDITAIVVGSSVKGRSIVCWVESVAASFRTPDELHKTGSSTSQEVFVKLSFSKVRFVRKAVLSNSVRPEERTPYSVELQVFDETPNRCVTLLEEVFKKGIRFSYTGFVKVEFMAFAHQVFEEIPQFAEEFDVLFISGDGTFVCGVTRGNLRALLSLMCGLEDYLDREKGFIETAFLVFDDVPKRLEAYAIDIHKHFSRGILVTSIGTVIEGVVTNNLNRGRNICEHLLTYGVTWFGMQDDRNVKLDGAATGDQKKGFCNERNVLPWTTADVMDSCHAQSSWRMFSAGDDDLISIMIGEISIHLQGENSGQFWNVRAIYTRYFRTAESTLSMVGKALVVDYKEDRCLNKVLSLISGMIRDNVPCAGWMGYYSNSKCCRMVTGLQHWNPVEKGVKRHDFRGSAAWSKVEGIGISANGDSQQEVTGGAYTTCNGLKPRRAPRILGCESGGST